MELIKNISNIIGWRTKRKIVVIESDDWGSVRIRSKKDFEEMSRKGLDLNNSNYTMNDCLESNSDLSNLFELLLKHKDSTGRPPVFTPMCIMANPDFEKIQRNNFQEYYYENFAETCNRYPNSNQVLDLWRTGIKERLFVPALHGREHLNVSRWLKLLQIGNKGVMTAFDHCSFGPDSYKGIAIPEYLGAFYSDKISDIAYLEEVIKTADELFKINCGYNPTHFIPPNRESVKLLDITLNKIGVKYLTMAKIRKHPVGNGKHQTELVWLGKKNTTTGQFYITRNSWFEPSHRHIDFVDRGLKEMEIAFRWGKPAVFSSHRVNFVGSIQPENAAYGLKELNRFLIAVIKKWPEIEFMTSTELGELIESGINQ